ncbi:MAG TPA: DUF5977 domain-containing protein [Puia sp.]|nr:DUF5977 domain-containing protein [Puia sp.]
MLSKRIVLAGFLILFSFVKVHSQVSLQNGTAVFSLPMFNWQDDKSRLTSMVALSYNSGNGLRVNDVASNVGQGWNLAAGGVIARMQVGEPDDQPEYHTYNAAGEQDNDLTKYPAGYLYHTIDPALGCPNSMIKYPIYKSQNQLYAPHNLEREDKQLDHFSFQFNGKAGMFILDTTGGDHGIPLGDTKLKITFTRDPTMVSQGIRTTITSFTVQDVDGLIYKFSQHSLTRVLCQEFCDQGLTTPIAQPTLKAHGVYYQYGFQVGYNNKQMVNPFIISSWYLSEIDDPFTGRKVTFNYAYTRTINNYAGADVSWNQWHNYIIIDNRNSMTTVPGLSSINYPDGHTVTFNYNASSRVDMSGDPALASVDIQYQGRYVSEYQLNTTYFILNRYGTPTTPYQKSVARLCLKSVRKIGVDLKEDTPPYIFDYYTGSTADDFVPPPFFYARDPWGFYNGNYSKGYDMTPVNVNLPNNINLLDWNSLQGLCYVNSSTLNAYTDPVSGFSVFGVYTNPKPGFAQNGLLKQIVYPTGGSLTYSYAQNSGSFMGSSTVQNMGGVHVSQTSSADGGFSNGCANPIVTSYNYVVNGVGSASSLWGMEAPLNMQVNGSHYAPEQKGFHCTWSSGCGCYWHFMYPGILSVGEAISLSTLQNFMNSIAPVLTILSTIMDVLDVINVCLDDTPAAIIAVILDAIAIIVTIGISCLHNYNKDGATPVYHNSNLNDVSPLPAQFKQVEIVENPGTIGKTVQRFTSSDDYALWLPGANAALSAKQRYAPWAYGLPLLKSVYDVNGYLIKQTQNVYDFSYAQELILEPCIGGPKRGCPPIASCKCLVDYSYSQRNTDWTQPSTYTYSAANYATASNSNMLVDIYDMYSGRVELDSTYERTYRVGDATQFVQTATVYKYNYLNYEVSTIYTTQSNGTQNTKQIYYTCDFYNGGNLLTLYNNNVVALPVAASIFAYNSTLQTNQILSEKVTEFASVANGDIRPSRILEQRFATPQSTYTLYPGPVTANYANYKILQNFTYDANSNLVGVKDEGGRSVTNLYEYNDKYIVASVVNADPVTDHPAITSFEGTGFGGWTLSGTASYSTTNFITGTRGFNLAGNTLTATLNTSRAYILSYWINTAGSVTLSAGATNTIYNPTNNGMRYYQYNIAQGTTSISVSGTGVIDELRLYPATSQARSTTYDPLIGKTSECDVNNRISYYSYDNLGRLQFIKDETMNIVKMYEYNNVSPTKQTGCPATFYNHVIAETVYPTCSAGYRPGTVTFTVPANKYTSTKNQLDADLQAEIDFLTNAQNYANANGACSLIYYNTAQSQADSTQSCTEGQQGGFVTYTVPANRYSSIISQADANQQALDEITANAQGYANDPAHAVCTVSTAPDWTWLEGDSTYCSSIGGALPAHQFVKETDLNPNSPTYHQTRWSDAGPQDYCPAGTYYNAQQSGTFSKACTTGYAGSSVTYTVSTGVYSSTASQAAADQLAANDIAANGQNYANTNGTCLLLYYNTVQSGTYTRQGCACGYTAGTYTTTVAANTYSSTVSVAAANQLAQNYIAANGQTNANTNGTCTNACTGEGKKLISCTCQLGSMICTAQVYNSSTKTYRITYHYQWSDGTISVNYTMTSSVPCATAP